MSRKKVVVTGMGVLCPIGIELTSYWTALVEGRSGISYLNSCRTKLERRPIGAEVPEFRPKDFIRPKKNIKVMSRDIQMGVVSASLACKNANLCLDSALRSVEPERLGCIFGCDLIGTELDSIKDAFKIGVENGMYKFSTWGSASMANIMPLWMLKYLPNMVASHIAIALDARGPNNTPTLDRGSSLAAIMEGCRIIERGAADVIIAGGVGNKITPSILARGGAYTLAPWTKSPENYPRPFDSNRCGTCVGEGSAAFVLESEEFALARGAKPLATVLGYAECVCPTAKFGIQQDAVENSIRQTLKIADRLPEDIGHMNSNGIGVDDDSLEAKGIARTLGEIPVFSAVGHFGNLGSGAGAVELVASILAINSGIIPATKNCEEVASDCPINVVHDKPHSLRNSTFIKVNHTNTGRSFAVLLEK